MGAVFQWEKYHIRTLNARNWHFLTSYAGYTCFDFGNCAIGNASLDEKHLVHMVLENEGALSDFSNAISLQSAIQLPC